MKYITKIKICPPLIVLFFDNGITKKDRIIRFIRSISFV